METKTASLMAETGKDAVFLFQILFHDKEYQYE